MGKSILTENLDQRSIFLSLAHGENTARPIAAAITSPLTEELLNMCGLTWFSVHKNHESMVKVALVAKSVMGFETARVPFDQCVEAEALGVELDFEGYYPKPRRFLEEIQEFNFMGRGRTMMVLQAVRDIREAFGPDFPILGGVTGPFTLLNYLLGPAKTMLLSRRDPNVVKDYADKLSESVANYAMEMVSAGADAIVIEDMASSPDVLNPMVFKTVEVEPLKRLTSMLKVPCILHICGDTLKILKDIPETGVEVFHIDPKTNLRVAKDLVRGVTLAGGVSTSLLSEGDEKSIAEASLSCIGLGIRIVAPACALHPKTPIGNVKTMIKAVKNSAC
ncbi:MAG: uroporphyrinogen decarboxylase family protein [Thermoproteota archaeon]